MDTLTHIKLDTGADLLGHVHEQTDSAICIINPVELVIDPIHGPYAKSWLLLSATNVAWLTRSRIVIMNDASEKAQSYYEDFIHRIMDDKPTEASMEDFTDELEDIFTSMMESKLSTKH